MTAVYDSILVRRISLPFSSVCVSSPPPCPGPPEAARGRSERTGQEGYIWEEVGVPASHSGPSLRSRQSCVGTCAPVCVREREHVHEGDACLLGVTKFTFPAVTRLQRYHSLDATASLRQDAHLSERRYLCGVVWLPMFIQAHMGR